MNAFTDPSPDTGEIMTIMLYIAGNSLNSMRAMTNLSAICQAHFPGRYQIELVDVFEDPLRAITDKVLITPTMIRMSPAPRLRVVGDLSDTQTVVLALQSFDKNR